MARLNLTLTEGEIRDAIAEYVERLYHFKPVASSLPLLVKSKNNYKQPWEPCSLAVTVEVNGEVHKEQLSGY